MGSGYPGLVAGAAANDGVRVRLDGKPTYRYDFSTVAGGWMPIDSSYPDILETGALGDSSLIVALNSVKVVKPISFPYSETDTPTSTIYTIETFALRYYFDIPGAGTTLTIQIMQVPRAGGAETVLDSWDDTTNFTTTASWTDFSETGLGIDLDFSTYLYYLKITAEPTAGVNISLGPMSLSISRGALE